ncbi:drug/metabolite transporter (DMT)-like permease [Stella humosa]|uniref:Drug/metabolite transporter (DMT)-like permease n=1 Tax=Stella humosa TaxID=94 RepID=A0A3N1L024_9PROT|nr:DMT family transporter [Stella humosa]ROP84280.1 drug/metabolite transporter (DMT)-like permease [Stella humosa]BBK33793.1 membrane protein [Stella humosa]
MPLKRQFDHWMNDLPPPIQGAIWMLIAAILFSCLNTLIRWLTAERGLPPFQAAFFRIFFGLLFMVPLMIRGGRAGLGRHNPLYLRRAVVGVLGMLASFYSIAHLPLATSTALSFTAPMFTTVLAVFFLGEVVRMRRWSAIIVGFLGAVVILRPGWTPLDAGMIAALLSAASSALNTIVIKQLSRTEPANAIVTWMALYYTPFLLIPALFVWEWPAWDMWPWIIAMGAMGSLGHMALTRSFTVADATVVMNFDYLRLPFSALLGLIFFAEWPDEYTFLGAAIIGLSGLYIAHREAKVSRVRAATTASATVPRSRP